MNFYHSKLLRLFEEVGLQSTCLSVINTECFFFLFYSLQLVRKRLGSPSMVTDAEPSGCAKLVTFAQDIHNHHFHFCPHGHVFKAVEVAQWRKKKFQHLVEGIFYYCKILILLEEVGI